MKLLLVTSVEPTARCVATVCKYAAAGISLGHSVAVFGEPRPDMPGLPYTTDLSGIDFAVFVIQVPSDFPDMPHLARLLDTVPRERRIVLDLWGRYNDTIRLDHDFNHLEKLDGHQGWEWEQAMEAVSGTILQPTLYPLRASVGSFLFHAFDPGGVQGVHKDAGQAAAAWRSATPAQKPYGAIYVGNNWQRWGQVKRFFEHYGAIRAEVGRGCLIGWDWRERPGWAVDAGVMGIDTDPAMLARAGVEVHDAVRFDEVVGLLGKARFAPILHRPLFQHLRLVTNRTFETFCADTLPVLMLPRDQVAAIYGPAALALVPEDDVGAHLRDALNQPEKHWDAVLQTRAHLALHHSFTGRFEQLETLLEEKARQAR
jgi:hypothetical protein